MSPLYEACWKPLKSLLDISGHVVNVMLRSNSELLTPYMVKKVADLAGESLKEAVESITTGRSFILEQIRNQEKARLLKFQFYKDLSNAKVWHQFRFSMDDLPSISSTNSAVASKPIKLIKEPKAKTIEPVPSDELPPAPIKLRIRASSNKEAAPKKKTEVKAKRAAVKIIKKSEKIAKKSELKKVAVTGRKRPGPKAKAERKPQKARRTDKTKSFLAPSLWEIELPVENDFEYVCPICKVVLEKSRKLPEILPRIKIHLSLHCKDDYIPTNTDKDDFSERLQRFILYVDKGKKDWSKDSKLLEFPSRDLSLNKSLLKTESVKQENKDQIQVRQEIISAPISHVSPKKNSPTPTAPRNIPASNAPKSLVPIKLKQKSSPQKKPVPINLKRNSSPQKIQKPGGLGQINPVSTNLRVLSPVSAPPPDSPLPKIPPFQIANKSLVNKFDALKSNGPKTVIHLTRSSPNKEPKLQGDVSDIYARIVPRSQLNNSPINPIDLTKNSEAPLVHPFDPRLIPQEKPSRLIVDLQNDSWPALPRLNRGADIFPNDICWKCGFRVLGRLCGQCGSLQ